MPKVSDDEFRKAVEVNSTAHGVLLQIGVTVSGMAYQVFHNRVRKLGLDTSHFSYIPEAKFVGRKLQQHRRVAILSRTDNCEICGIHKEWNGMPLSFQVDHINGNRYDHREENLRVICPNCHSQTETFAGKKRGPITVNVCSGCGIKITAKAKMCQPCNLRQPRKRRTKIEWPSNTQMQELVWKYPMIALKHQLGVSDRSIAKHCKKFGIDTPPPSWWSSNKAGMAGDDPA